MLSDLKGTIDCSVVASWQVLILNEIYGRNVPLILIELMSYYLNNGKLR